MGKIVKPMTPATAFRKASRDRERRGFLSATPERMAKDGEPFRCIDTVDELGANVETQQLTASPLDRLYRTGGLGADEDIATARHEAGQQLYAHWYWGRLFALGSRDYRQPARGSGDSFAIMPATERQAYHRMKWRQADAELGGDRIASVTRSIVLDEREPVDVGRIITGRNHEQTARAIAIEYLIDGLDRLRALWTHS